MRIALRVLGLLAVVFVGLVLVAYVGFGKVVYPNEIGVRQNYFGVAFLLPPGYEDVGLEPGLHWQLPYLSEVIVLPRGFQLIHFNSENQRGKLDLDALEIPTSDGSKVRVDTTLVLRLFPEPGKQVFKETPFPRPTRLGTTDSGTNEEPRAEYTFEHGGPRELIEAYSREPEAQLERVSQIAQRELMASLGTISTSQFYDPHKREVAASAAQQATSKVVGKQGVEVWGVFSRRYAYLSDAIDNQIFERVSREQSQALNEALTRLAAAQAKTREELEGFTAKLNNEKEKAENIERTATAQADLEVTRKEAEGDLLIAEAEAKVLEERAKILADNPGTEAFIAKEVLPLVRSMKGGVVSGVDPFDLDRWTDRLMGTSQEGGPKR